MRNHRSWLLATLMAILTVVGATACGIPRDGEPQPLEIPPQYRSTQASTQPPTAAPSGGLTAMLCLTRDQALVEVLRPVENPPSPHELLASLMDGPTEAETQEEGLSSALTGIRTISIANIEQGIAEVEVGDSLEGITTPNQLLIYGQIVCTLYGHPAVTGVRFSRNGEPLSVPRGDLRVTTDVLTTDDYADLIEPA